MPTLGTDSIAARVPFECANRIEYDAKQRGISRNALLNEILLAYNAKRTAEEKGEAEAQVVTEGNHDLYGVALSLIDDLTAAGYPDSEIRMALKNIRDEML